MITEPSERDPSTKGVKPKPPVNGEALIGKFNERRNAGGAARLGRVQHGSTPRTPSSLVTTTPTSSADASTRSADSWLSSQNRGSSGSSAARRSSPPTSQEQVLRWVPQGSLLSPTPRRRRLRQQGRRAGVGLRDPDNPSTCGTPAAGARSPIAMARPRSKPPAVVSRTRATSSSTSLMSCRGSTTARSGQLGGGGKVYVGDNAGETPTAPCRSELVGVDPHEGDIFVNERTRLAGRTTRTAPSGTRSVGRSCTMRSFLGTRPGSCPWAAPSATRLFILEHTKNTDPAGPKLVPSLFIGARGRRSSTRPLDWAYRTNRPTSRVRCGPGHCTVRGAAMPCWVHRPRDLMGRCPRSTERAKRATTDPDPCDSGRRFRSGARLGCAWRPHPGRAAGSLASGDSRAASANDRASRWRHHLLRWSEAGERR